MTPQCCGALRLGTRQEGWHVQSVRAGPSPVLSAVFVRVRPHSVRVVRVPTLPDYHCQQLVGNESRGEDVVIRREDIA